MSLESAVASGKAEKIIEDNRLHNIILKSTREQVNDILADAKLQAEMIVERARQDAVNIAAEQIKTESVFRKKAEDRLREMETLGRKLSDKEMRLKKLDAQVLSREADCVSTTRRLLGEDARLKKRGLELTAWLEALNDEVLAQAAESLKLNKLANDLYVRQETMRNEQEI